MRSCCQSANVPMCQKTNMPNGGAADVNRDICMKLHGTGPFVLQLGRQFWDWPAASELLYGTDDWCRALLVMK